MKRLAMAILVLVGSASCGVGRENTSYTIRFGVVEKSGSTFVFVRETSRLPLAPHDDNHLSGLEITPSGTRPYTVDVTVFPPGSAGQGTRQPSLSRSGRSILPMWFDPGDPPGTYRLEVKIDGAVVKTIEFEAVEPGSTDTHE